MFAKKIFALGMLFFTFLIAQGNAEILRVTVRWTPGLCDGANCAPTLDKYLAPLTGNAEHSIDLSSGQVRLRWKPNTPFSFDQLNTAMRMAGLSIREVRVKVRGTVNVSGNVATMISIGDGTKFNLMGPTAIPGNSNDAAVQYSQFTHGLPQGTLQKLADAQRTFQIVEIDGPLFEPARSLSYGSTNLIVDQLTFPNPPFKH